MMPSFSDQKDELRRRLRATLKSIDPSQRAEASRRAAERLRRQSVWKNARSVLFYAPMSSEIDLVPLFSDAFREGKKLALLRFLSEEKAYSAFEISDFSTCVPGKFGIIEPNENCAMIALNQLDLVLVPGVGFSNDGHRLGRGQGFYDRLLARVTGIKCGVAFDEQIIEQVPAEPHDVRMNCILTPMRWIEIAISTTSGL
jgi:5-formyltetrahydrofolate cyclo-ligase